MNSFVEKFKEEVKDYFTRLEAGLLQLEHDPENHQIIDEVFRIMHSMKGSGGMFGYDLLSEVTHDLESLYVLFRSQNYTIDPEVITFTLNSIDGLNNLLVQKPCDEHRLLAEKLKLETQKQIARLTGEGNSPEKDGFSVGKAQGNTEVRQTTWYISFVPDGDILKNGTNPLYLIDELNALGECNIGVSFDRLPELTKIEPDKCYVSWSLFMATEKSIETLRDVFIFVADNAAIQIEKVSAGNVIQNETVLAGFLNAWLNGEPWVLAGAGSQEDEKPAEESEVAVSLLETPQKNTDGIQTTVDSIRVDSKKIDHYMNLVSELITTQSRLALIASKSKLPELEHLAESFGKLSRQIHDNAFDMSLIPIQSIEVRFKRLVYDLSKSLGKDVVLETGGMETELDKNIVEKLIDPLLHIIRNAVDHGIESQEDRLKKQKEASGTISIKCSTMGSAVQIEIEDDGAGLDIPKIREKAIANGMISEQDRLSDNKVCQLIFKPGFSTSESVTGVSGRGVGMDVVWRRIQELRGTIELATEKDRYTRFTINLPLSLSIIDGLLTTVGEGFFVIPSMVISKIHMINRETLKKNAGQFVELDGAEFPCVNLHEIFVGPGNIPEEQYVVLVSVDGGLYGLVVDEVIHEYQAVIKPIGRLSRNQDAFSGASILGTGQIALVIDSAKMIKKYSQHDGYRN